MKKLILFLYSLLLATSAMALDCRQTTLEATTEAEMEALVSDLAKLGLPLSLDDKVELADLLRKRAREHTGERDPDSFLELFLNMIGNEDHEKITALLFELEILPDGLRDQKYPDNDVIGWALSRTNPPKPESVTVVYKTFRAIIGRKPISWAWDNGDNDYAEAAEMCTGILEAIEAIDMSSRTPKRECFKAAKKIREVTKRVGVWVEPHDADDDTLKNWARTIHNALFPSPNTQPE